MLFDVSAAEINRIGWVSPLSNEYFRTLQDDFAVLGYSMHMIYIVMYQLISEFETAELFRRIRTFSFSSGGRAHDNAAPNTSHV